MDLLVYEVTGHRDKWLRLIFLGSLLVIIVPALLYYANGGVNDALIMLGVAAFIAIVLTISIPRKYCVFSNSMKILFGGPFSLTFPFEAIETVRIPRGFTPTLNFPSSLSNSHAVEIVRKKRINIVITPDDRPAFIDHLNNAIHQWTITNKRVA